VPRAASQLIAYTRLVRVTLAGGLISLRSDALGGLDCHGLVSPYSRVHGLYIVSDHDVPLLQYCAQRIQVLSQISIHCAHIG
jgi:hypothetical protein